MGDCHYNDYASFAYRRRSKRTLTNSQMQFCQTLLHSRHIEPMDMYMEQLCMDRNSSQII